MSLALPGMPLHDPFVHADESTSTYYLYTSNVEAMSGVAGCGTMAYRSQDLRDWDAPVVVFLAGNDLWARDGGWAPEVHRYRDRYYLFTTLHDERRPLPVPSVVPNAYGMPARLRTHMRGTIIAVSDSPLGPFVVLDATRPTTPEEFMALDGTLHVDGDGQPWMVYAHEWLQKLDGTMEAIRLSDDLSSSVGQPVHLFKASDAFWVGEGLPAPSSDQLVPYVTDGPELYAAPDGALVLLWSTYEKTRPTTAGAIGGDYVQTMAVSPSGQLEGPWVQQRPLVRGDSGHGMLFSGLDNEERGKLFLILHRPFRNARGKIYEAAWHGSALQIIKQRTDLDGGG